MGDSLFKRTFYTEKLKRYGDRETELGVCNLRLYILTMGVEIDAERDRSRNMFPETQIQISHGGKKTNGEKRQHRDGSVLQKILILSPLVNRS